MGSVYGRRSSCEARCAKVLWRKRGTNASVCCNLATAAKILGELCADCPRVRLEGAGRMAKCRKSVVSDYGASSMTRSSKAKSTGAGPKAAATPHLPDPKIPTGPYRPFTCDPGWNEAWWWLGVPVLVAAFTIGSYQFSPEWYRRYVIPEGYGILEISHFFIP